MKKVAVIGVGETKFGEHWYKSFRDLAVEAGIKSMEDANLERKDIGALFVGNMSAGKFIGQEHVASLVADHLGFSGIPCIRTESACASGSLAFRQALLSLQSGAYDAVMVEGVEKMTDIIGSQASLALMGAGDQEWEASVGLTFPGLYALIARRHMHEYGTTPEQLAMFSVNNHKNAVKNPDAQFRFEISVEDVLNSPLIADPLHLLDCSPITDGAASVLLATEDFIKKKKIKNPIWVLGSGQSSDTVALQDRKSLTSMFVTIDAAKKAYKQSGLKPKDIKIAEVHDCFSINGLVAIEDLGFCKKGEGGKFIEDGNISLGSTVSINTSGGLKAKGHPVGATGISQIIEIVKQLRGECEKRQVDAKYGLTHNIGGSGASCLVHIFGKEK